MQTIQEIIDEEIMTTVANHPQFGDRLGSISEDDENQTLNEVDDELTKLVDSE